ncbi:MAG: tetratricopeptide repeat protein [Muribaculaceae bacterium]|nr:tetratricopeptide repeat protein [Muribaculaceae bacterium]
MKAKFFIAAVLLAGAALSSFAQGYKDGIEYYKVGQLDNAKELLERNLNSTSTDKSEAYYYLGMIAMDQGNLAEAQSYFDKGLAANAGNPYNLVGMGALELRKGGNGKAQFDAARKLSKKDPKLETAIARAYYAANPTTYAKDIEKCVKNAQKWDMNDPDSHIFLGDQKADEKAWGDAAGLYELAFTSDPNNVEAYVKYANTYFNVVPEMAIERLQELLAKQPNSVLVQRQLAEKYYEGNQGRKAAEQYGEYIKNPNHFAQDEVRYVQLLFFGEKYQESYDLATSLIGKLKAGDEKVFYMRRMQLYNLVMLEKWNEAVEAGKAFFGMALPTGSTYEVRDYTDYGKALQNAGMTDEAIAAYKKALEINPQNADLIRYMGDTYADANDFVNAAAYYQQLYDKQLCSANDIFTLSTYYYGIATLTEGGEKEAAIAQSQKYLDEVDAKVPGNVQIVNQKAKLAKLIEGDQITGKAAPAYRELIGILDAKEDKSGYDRYYRFAYNYLANYEFTQGDKTKAKEYYRKWLEHDPENEALRKYVEQMK